MVCDDRLLQDRVAHHCCSPGSCTPTDADSQSERYAHSNANGDSNGYAYADSYANCDSHSYAYTLSYANRNS